MKPSARWLPLLFTIAVLTGCEKPAPPPAPTSNNDDEVRRLREQVAALEDQVKRQAGEIAELRHQMHGEPAPTIPLGPSRDRLQAICDRTFGHAIANVLGIQEGPNAVGAIGEIRITNLAVQGGVASGKAIAKIAHYNDGRWLLKSILLNATNGGQFSWDFEEEL